MNNELNLGNDGFSENGNVAKTCNDDWSILEEGSSCTPMLWILEDEKSCQFMYEESLSLRYETKIFSRLSDFREALNGKRGKKPDLVIADLRLENESFLKFINHEQDMALLGEIPFVIISSTDDIDVLKKCFEEGALDYLTKPFSKNELVVKVERALEESTKVSKPVVSMDKTKMLAETEFGEVKLTPKEMQILSILKHAKGEAVCRDEIVSRVWDTMSIGAKTLDVHLFNLRRKTKHLGVEIKFIYPNSLKLLGDRVHQ